VLAQLACGVTLPTRRRVAPLAPDDRRAALIEATIPLLIEHGTAVSTRQIAQAAGVAEGTIFRVFRTRRRSSSPRSGRASTRPRACGRSAGSRPNGILRTRLTHVAERMLGGMEKVGRLHMIARECVMNGGPDSDFGDEMLANRNRVHEALTALIAPDADRLRVPPATAAQLLPHVPGEHERRGVRRGRTPIEPAEVVSLLLDGMLAPLPEQERE